MAKRIFLSLATLLFVTQTAWADITVTEEDVLRTSVGINQTVTLGADIMLTIGRLDINGTTVTLNLNGHQLRRSLSAPDAGGQVIFLLNNGKLTITDESDNSGKITGGWSFQGGAIYVSEGCSLTVSGGTITGNRADTTAGGYGLGGAIENHGTLTISGGIITGNTAGTYGGGIYNIGTVNMSGATISGNTAQSGGGAICSGGEVFLHNVTITGNNANYGGGIYMFKPETSPGTVQLSGECTITGNTAQKGSGIIQVSNGAGVAGPTLKMQDKPVVANNTSDDVYLQSYQLITITGSLNTGASIGVFTEVKQDHFTSGYSTHNNTAAPSTYFFVSGICTGNIIPNGGEAKIEITGYKYFERAWDAEAKKVTETIKPCDSFTPINGNDTSDSGWLGLNNGWYVVTGNSHYKMVVVQGNDVNLIIPDGVTFTVDGHVKLLGGNQLTIYGQVDDIGTLDVRNEVYDDCAGIGSDGDDDDDEDDDCGILVVHGGTINAKGNGWGAGIGGGKNYGFSPQMNQGGLTVYGGKITAIGGEGAAGIGSSCNVAMAGYITIYGGEVYAEGSRRDNLITYEGAGIGGGDESPGGIVHIYGGNVTAKGAIYGAGIGGGCDAPGYETYIHGGTVTAISEKGAGIGGGKDYGGGLIVIDGGTINATSDKGAGIGCGQNGKGATITINGGNVTATSKETGAGIGGGQDENDGANDLYITINGGIVNAKGINGIGPGVDGNGGGIKYEGTLTINGGHVYAMGSFRAIGGSNAVSVMTLYDGAMVRYGDTAESTTVSNAQDRKQVCIDNDYVAIEPCTHSGAGFHIDDGNTHRTNCGYCMVGAEVHSFGDDSKCVCGLVALNDKTDNATILSTWNDKTVPVTLQGRTLYKDGSWNTLCLPFAVESFTGTPLEGATVKTLESAAFDSQTGTLTLNFSTNNLTGINAGVPYIVKWATAQTPDAVENPVFNGMTISNSTADVETDVVNFHGIFSPYAISGEDRTLLYLGADDKLYYPNDAMTINAFRAYFELNGLTAGDPATSDGQGINSLAINFGDGTNSIENGILKIENGVGGWYTLDGRKLTSAPTTKGIYINNGKKIVIK